VRFSAARRKSEKPVGTARRSRPTSSLRYGCQPCTTHSTWSLCTKRNRAGFATAKRGRRVANPHTRGRVCSPEKKSGTPAVCPPPSDHACLRDPIPNSKFRIPNYLKSRLRVSPPFSDPCLFGEICFRLRLPPFGTANAGRLCRFAPLWFKIFKKSLRARLFPAVTQNATKTNFSRFLINISCISPPSEYFFHRITIPPSSTPHRPGQPVHLAGMDGKDRGTGHPS